VERAPTHHYQVTKIVIETSNISKYGVPDLGHAMAAGQHRKAESIYSSSRKFGVCAAKD
jgi:hypothetical protein